MHPEVDHLVKRALELPVEDSDGFLRSHVPDPVMRSEVERRLGQFDATEVIAPPTDVKHPDGPNVQQGNDDATIASDQGSTQHLEPNTNTGDMLSLPTIETRHHRPDIDAESIGQIGEYDLLDEIARGGMGVVFKARHRVLKRLVAIKIPRAAQLEDEGEARFLREAQAAAQLRHPNICPIYEVGHSGKQPFIALGYVDGPTLRQRLADKISPRSTAEIMAKVARAVHYAHDHTVIHRDIKPSNIMLEGESDEPVLMDFGLAKQLSEGDSHVTKSGQVMGTPVYMAPEQAAGRHEQIGPQTDVYSLGAVLYELLTGRPPFQGPTGDVIRQVQTDEPTPPKKLTPTLHRDLETICLKAMSKQPAARYMSAAALADDLERFATGDAILARREGPVRRTARFFRRHSKVTAILLTVALLAGSVAAYFAWSAREVNQVANINRQFHEGLQATTLTEADRDELESLVKRLREFDPVGADSAQRQLQQNVAKRTRDRIASSGALQEGDFQKIEQDIAWLESRDATAAETLAKQLQTRRRAWQELLTLVAPYENYGDIFHGYGIDVGDDGISYSPEPAKNEKSRDADLQLLTKIPSAGSVRLEARFAKGFNAAQQLGLLLHANDQQGYQFRVRAPALPRRSTRRVHPDEVRIWHHMEVGGDVEVEILRDGLLLRQTTLPANNIFDSQTGELTMIATVDGDRLSFQLGEQPALIFEDIFPYVGAGYSRFGLIWPPEAKLVALTASHKPLPVKPSPLEQGDQLFAQGQWDAALTQYRQASLANETSLLEQAKFKQALCLARLEDDEAFDLLESLTQSSDKRLRLLAACQLWLLHLQRSQYDDAAVVFESLKSQYDFQQLALLVPQAERQAIMRRTYNATTGLNLFRFGEDDLRTLEQASNINNLLDPLPTANDRGMRTWQLLRGLHVTGEIGRGIQLVQSYRSHGVRLDENMAISILSEGSWLWRQNGESKRALEMLNQHIKDRKKANSWQLQLLVERARVRVAQQKWDEAKSDLDFFLASEHCLGNYREFSAACLMRGLLHQRDGEMEQAQEHWHRGLHENWLNEASESRPVGPSLTGMQAANALLISALCGDRSDKEIVDLLMVSFPLTNSGATAQLAKQYSHVLAPAIANMGKSDRGQQVIWRIAFQEDTLKQILREPANLIFLEMTRLGAAPGDWSRDEEQIVWDMMNAGFDLYSREEVGVPQAVQIMLTWKGANNIFGWKGIAPSLNASMRGPAAYVFGHRFIRLGKPDDAREFFAMALADAPEESRLKELAQAQLQQLRERDATGGN